MNHLSRKVILITGASRGIGAATAQYLAGQGAQVVLFARDAARLDEHNIAISQRGGTALAIAGDVADSDDVRRAVEKTVTNFGRLDVLVNNAGLIDPIATLADSDPQAWSRVVDVNLKGVYYGMRHAIPVMLHAGSGTIINISSGAATKALAGWSHYCATKAGVLALTRCGHEEYGERGIRVVGLSPGTVATDMQDSIRRSGINPVSQLDPGVHIPPEWVAQAVGYLCGEAASEFAGTDFSMKTDDGRRRLGLPLKTQS